MFAPLGSKHLGNLLDYVPAETTTPPALVGNASTQNQSPVGDIPSGPETTATVDPYPEVKQASQYLQDMGVPRAQRVQILQSFDVSTLTVQTADDATFAIRFHDFGQTALPMGQFLTDTFTPLTNPGNLSLPPQWNGMTGISQWQITQGTTYLRGQVAPQLQLGSQYVGGADQIFVLKPWEYGSLVPPQ